MLFKPHFLKLLLAFSLLQLNACNNEPTTELLPDAVGNVGDIMVVADEAFWKSDAGKRFKKIFNADLYGMPQAEPSFNVVYLPVEQFHGFAEKYRNVIFVGFANDASTTSEYVKKSLGEQGAAKVLADTTKYFYLRENLKAKNQMLMFCYAPNPTVLINRFEKEASNLRDFFNRLETKRTAERLERLPKNLNSYQKVKNKFGFSLNIPEAYRIRIDSANFVWLARDDKEKSLNLLLFTFEYNGKADFEPENLNHLRDSITKVLVPGPTAGSYMATETEVPVLATEKSFNGKYMLDLRGLWKVENDFMGGPMFHQAVYQANTNTVIHAVGFVYFPNSKKREWLRELEALFATANFN